MHACMHACMLYARTHMYTHIYIYIHTHRSSAYNTHSYYVYSGFCIGWMSSHPNSCIAPRVFYIRGSEMPNATTWIN